jgi:dynein heavy chain
MTMMFEVEDLAVASPATVSRCGMVYTEPTSLGFDVLVQSWIEALPPCMSNAMRAQLQALFDTYVKSTLYFLRRYLEEPVPTADNQLCYPTVHLNFKDLGHTHSLADLGS